MGRPGGVSGTSWVRLGRVLGPSWGRIGNLGASWERLGAVLKRLGDVLGAFHCQLNLKAIFDRFLIDFGTHVGSREPQSELAG